MGFCIVKRYLGFEGSHISGENNGEKTIVKGSTGAHQTRAQNFRVSLKNDVDIWTFVRLSAKIAPSRHYLYLLYIRCWAINMTWYWFHAVRSYNICSRLWSVHALEHLEAANAKETMIEFSSLLTIVDVFEGLVGRDAFSAIAPVQGPQKTERLCHPVPCLLYTSDAADE